MGRSRDADPWHQVRWAQQVADQPLQVAGSMRGRRARLTARPPLALPQLEDLDGTQHYATLGVEPTASAEEIKKARGPPPPPLLPPARPPPLPSIGARLSCPQP